MSVAGTQMHRRGGVRVSRRQFLATGLLTLAGCGAVRGLRDAKVSSWGGPGQRDGEFKRPRAIAAHEGEIYVIDTTGRVQVFSPAGTYRRTWSMPDARNGTPTGLTFAADGTVVIPDTHYSCIRRYDVQGKRLDEWGEYGTGTDQFVFPTDVAIDGQGTYYISEYGMNAERIHVFDKNHAFVRQWGQLGDGPKDLNRAMGIELGKDGALYVADTANHRVQCFDTQGQLLRTISKAGTGRGEIKFPYQIALAPDDSLLVCEYGNHRISRFTSDGAFVASLGSPGRGSGEFSSPRGVAVSKDGVVYVADTENHRVQYFHLEELG